MSDASCTVENLINDDDDRITPRMIRGWLNHGKRFNHNVRAVVEELAKVQVIRTRFLRRSVCYIPGKRHLLQCKPVVLQLSSTAFGFDRLRI